MEKKYFFKQRKEQINQRLIPAVSWSLKIKKEKTSTKRPEKRLRPRLITMAKHWSCQAGGRPLPS